MPACPKPERLATSRRRQARQQAEVRAACRRVVIARAGGLCEVCGVLVADDCEPHLPYRAHVHEIVPRSLGGNPYDPNNCQLLCRLCHLPNGQHRAGVR